MFDYAVIGKGLIGAAAARYLSEISAKVAIVGPDEPDNWQNHQGVFASHYDQGRITRVLDPDPVWAVQARRSIEQYRSLEQASGIRFYHPVGGLQAGPASSASGDFVSQLQTVGQELGVEFKSFNDDGLTLAFPFFDFPEGMAGIFEPETAGYINPRSFVAAQLELAGQQGAAIIREQVVSIKREAGFIEIKTAGGNRYRSRKVLIAAGAYTNQLLDQPLHFELRLRTILLAELPAAEVARLHCMPTLIYRLLSPISQVDSIYMLPPIQYPDGKYYIKIGGGNSPKEVAENFDELRDWFQSGGSGAEAGALKDVLLSIMPDLKISSFHHKPCVTAYTPHDHLYIDAIEADQLFIAAGGCGSAAKSSNEIGRLAALLMTDKSWPSDLAREMFSVTYREALL